jgi:multimeric flavodoxin WrbA
MGKKIVAIVGSYRKEGTIDTAIEAILAGARERGAATHAIYLPEKHIEFCRKCMQPGGHERGKCTHKDDMEPILRELETADAVVLGSPVNCGNTTAIYRRFMERLLGCFYWPWGQRGPRLRRAKFPVKRKAVLVASSGMPGVMIPLFTGTMGALRQTAKVLHAKPVGRMCIGLASGEEHHPLSTRRLAQARRLGMRLAA